jgi:uncharacterized protein YycO
MVYNAYMITTIILSLFGCNTTPQNDEITATHSDDSVQVGDILIQEEYSSQSWAVREATNSNITHVGVVIDADGRAPLDVIEAVGPVRITSIENFNSRGPTQILRLKNADSHRTNINTNLGKASASYLGRPYDFKFKWDNENIYCSELVWKAYADIGIKVAEASKFSDLNLDGQLTKQLISERLTADEKVDVNETIVTPADLERSPYLVKVK